MQRMIVFVLAALLCAPFALAGEPLPAFEKYTSEGNRFRALVPSGWTRSGRNAPYADMTPVAGARFDGPPTGESVPASIALYWYSGEWSFTTPDSYINARLGSMVREDTERGREIAALMVAGRNAAGFRMKTFELVTLPHDRLNVGTDDGQIVFERVAPSKKVIMEEQYVVVPATKGYFVLHYRAPESVFILFQPIFEKVTAAFEPLVP